MDGSVTTAHPSNSIVPWLSVSKCAQAVEFYKIAFGAVEAYRLEDPGGSIVANLSYPRPLRPPADNGKLIGHPSTG
jgi:uncharacterized glyoxalase superfamily protein PhnB